MTTPATTAKDKLRELRTQGLTFGDCIRVFAEGQEDEALIAKARDEIEREGEIEIDEFTVVSRGEDHGAYVMAWVWVEDK